jgi:predicted ATPase
VKNIRLKNGYKRFHDLTIDLGDKPARIVALVGPNGCGKSSVLDGMLYQQLTRTSIGQTGRRSNSYYFMEGSGLNDSASIEFDKGSLNNAMHARRVAGKPNTLFSFRSCYRYNADVKISESRATDDIATNNYGASATADIDAKMEQNYRRSHGKYNKYSHDKDVKPSEAKAQIIGELNESLIRCLNLEVESLGNLEMGQGTLYFKKPDHPKPFEFNVLSAGEKEVVDILLDLYLRKEDYSDTVFLVDEPELHINTAIQRKLLVEMNRLVGADCQLWVATHSVGFLRALQEDLKGQCQIIQFKADVPYASTQITLKPLVPSLQVWRDIFTTALDDIVGLMSPKRIIYSEGRDIPGAFGRERGLDAQVFNAIFSQHYIDTLFVSSGGNTELDQRSAIAIAILSKVFPSVEIWVLKDRDMASGAATNEKDRIVYLANNPDTHRVLKRWEIENYLYDKEVLTAFCQKSGYSLDETKYESLVTDIVNQDVKALTNGIKTACGIIGSINADKFKRNLAEVISPDMAVYKELEECIFQRK